MYKKNRVAGAVLLAVLAAAVGAGLLAWAPRQPASPGAVATAGAPAGAGPVVAAPLRSDEGEAGVRARAAQAVQAPSSNPLDHVILPVFRATTKGTLATDPQTRLDVERIHALFGRDEAQARLQEAASQLPDQARRELAQLYQQYVQYAQAVAQTFPPDQGGGTIEDAGHQLNGLHELRQQYFGQERADAMFGEEERISRELLALMRQSKDPNLSLEDKAAQAQEAWRRAQAAQQ